MININYIKNLEATVNPSMHSDLMFNKISLVEHFYHNGELSAYFLDYDDDYLTYSASALRSEQTSMFKYCCAYD